MISNLKINDSNPFNNIEKSADFYKSTSDTINLDPELRYIANQIEEGFKGDSFLFQTTFEPILQNSRDILNIEKDKYDTQNVYFFNIKNFLESYFSKVYDSNQNPFNLYHSIKILNPIFTSDSFNNAQERADESKKLKETLHKCLKEKHKSFLQFYFTKIAQSITKTYKPNQESYSYLDYSMSLRKITEPLLYHQAEINKKEDQTKIQEQDSDKLNKLGIFYYPKLNDTYLVRMLFELTENYSKQKMNTIQNIKDFAMKLPSLLKTSYITEIHNPEHLQSATGFKEKIQEDMISKIQKITHNYKEITINELL